MITMAAPNRSYETYKNKIYLFFTLFGSQKIIIIIIIIIIIMSHYRMSMLCQLTPTFLQCTSLTTVWLILNFTLFTANFFKFPALALVFIC